MYARTHICTVTAHLPASLPPSLPACLSAFHRPFCNPPCLSPSLSGHQTDVRTTHTRLIPLSRPPAPHAHAHTHIHAGTRSYQVCTYYVYRWGIQMRMNGSFTRAGRQAHRGSQFTARLSRRRREKGINSYIYIDR